MWLGQGRLYYLMHSSHCKSISPKVLGSVLCIKAFAHKNLDFKGRLKERRCFDPQFTDRGETRRLKVFAQITLGGYRKAGNWALILIPALDLSASLRTEIRGMAEPEELLCVLPRARDIYNLSVGTEYHRKFNCFLTKPSNNNSHSHLHNLYRFAPKLILQVHLNISGYFFLYMFA